MMQIQLADPDKCYGCGACSVACPKHCISMNTNKFGEYRPVFTENDCVQCGKCMEVCPALHQPKLIRPKSVWAMSIVDDDKRRGSASGGAARLLYEWALERDAVVFGCDFDSDHILKMRSASSLSEIEGFRNSKYTFCRTEGAFQETKKLLDEGRSVLFIGSSCQIDALRRVIGYREERLITVDLICHGVPPESYFREYLVRQEERLNRKIDKVYFRGEKKENNFFLQLFSESIVCYEKYARLDTYYAGYVNCLMYEEKCYSCPYATKERVADISIGDWGGDSQVADKKLSVILANTHKGCQVIESVLQQQEIEFELHTIEEAEECNEQLRGPVARPKQYDEMRECYCENGFWTMSQKYITPYILNYQNRRRKEYALFLLKLPFRMIKKMIRIVRKQ